MATYSIPISLPTSSDEEMAFQTFRGYLEAVCRCTTTWNPHVGGLVAGVAAAVHSGGWMGRAPRGRALSARAAEVLRNGWATEVLLNSPRVLGGADLVAFANLWAPVQAYYAVFNSFTAMAMVVTGGSPKTHASLLKWAATEVGKPGSPFVAPWTARVGGALGAYTYAGFGTAALNLSISNLAAPTIANAPSLLAMALRTTRRDQIEEHRPVWMRGLKTTSGRPRRNLPRAVLATNAMAMRPTTLFDLLYRLRLRSNYREGDALLSGALGPADAATFHTALTEIVAATLLTTEIYLVHVVGRTAMVDVLSALPIPSNMRRYSVAARTSLW